MFRPYKVIPRPTKKTDPRDIACISLLGGPENDLIRSKHVALTKYTIFVYKIKCCVINGCVVFICYNTSG